MSVVTKTWGFYEDMFRSEDLVLKKLTILPGEKISHQKHFKRNEIWMVISGFGQLALNKKITDIKPGDKFSVAIEDWHQVKNIGDSLLECYEIQQGFCSEDDIERIEDII